MVSMLAYLNPSYGTLMPALSKREQIVTEAQKFFYQYGFNATGVDRIIAEAGASKKTLYNHFKSKDEFIFATLRKHDELFRNHFMRETERIANTPRERLLALFDVLGMWFHDKNFSGCMFVNAAAEFSATDNPCHLACAEHKRLVGEYIKALAVAAEVQEADELAKKFNLLIEGAIGEAHICGNKEAVVRA